MVKNVVSMSKYKTLKNMFKKEKKLKKTFLTKKKRRKKGNNCDNSTIWTQYNVQCLITMFKWSIPIKIAYQKSGKNVFLLVHKILPRGNIGTSRLSTNDI